jgi:GxxExxY protein
MRITYKGHQLNKSFVVDFLCFEQLLTEIKALKELSGGEQAQLLNYLKVSGCHVGLLINFGARGKLEWQRLVL